MSSEFDDWIESLHLAEPDEGGDVGNRPAGMTEFLREAFDAYGGPVPRTALEAAWHEREMSLVVHAAGLVEADLRRTTTLTPLIETRALDDGTIAVTYNGNYRTPVIFSIRAPEAICEVADNLRDHAVDDLWSVWPTCPTDGSALDPRRVDGQAVWHCRVGNHTVSEIGRLPRTS